jgi:succinate dehydrogenase / fumarate reductase cytochrome b subunit
MAVTGLILIGYLLAHMYGNLKVFAGPAAFNEYAHHLRTLGEPILPYSGVLWIIRVILIVSIFAHMYAAFTLWSRARKARGGVRRYRSNKARRGVQRTYASFTLRWGGVVIVLFVIYHLLHLTWNITWSALTTLGANTSSLARQRLNVIAYAVAGLLTIGFLLPPFAILFGFVS